MQKLSRLAAVAVSGACLLFAGGEKVFAQASATVVAKVFDPAPDGNGVFGGFAGSPPALNNAGQAVFSNDLLNSSGGTSDFLGVFRGSGGPLVQIYRKGQTVPGGNGTIATVAFPAPALNDAGQVAFIMSLDGTSGGTADNRVIFRGDGGPLVQIARKGQADPGNNGIINDFIPDPVINNAGQVAFQALLSGTRGGTADDRAIFRGDGGALTQIVREGQTAPGGGTFGALSTPDLNAVGQVSFLSFLSSGGRGIYRGDGGALVQIARSGQAAPGGNGTLATLGVGVPLNDSGQVVFDSTLSGTTGGDTDNAAIYRGDGGALVQIARTGQAAPDGNGRFASLPSAPVSTNNRGQVAFTASLTGTTGGPNDERGFFRGDGVNLVQIVRNGQALPDGDGTFFLAGTPTLNNSGQTVFITGFDGNAIGDGLARGIYAYDDDNGLIKVIRTGDSFLGSKIYTLGFNTSIQHATAGGNGGFNDLGQIAFDFGLEDGRTGVAIVVVPEPASLSVLALGGTALLCRRRRASRITC